jgi:hypothetical protein
MNMICFSSSWLECAEVPSFGALEPDQVYLSGAALPRNYFSATQTIPDFANKVNHFIDFLGKSHLR